MATSVKRWSVDFTDYSGMTNICRRLATIGIAPRSSAVNVEILWAQAQDMVMLLWSMMMKTCSTRSLKVKKGSGNLSRESRWPPWAGGRYQWDHHHGPVVVVMIFLMTTALVTDNLVKPVILSWPHSSSVQVPSTTTLAWLAFWRITIIGRWSLKELPDYHHRQMVSEWVPWDLTEIIVSFWDLSDWISLVILTELQASRHNDLY